MNKEQVIKYISNTINIADTVKSKAGKPLMFSGVVGSAVAGFSLYSGTALWMSLLPALIPFGILAFFWKTLDDVTSIKDDILEIGDYLSSLKELKSMKIETNDSGKVGLRANLANIKKVAGLIADASTIKDAPGTLMDAASSIKSIGLAFNPLAISLSVISFLTLWVFTVTAPLMLLF